MSQVVLLSIVLLLACAASVVQGQSVAVPSYIYPGKQEWQMITSAPGKVAFALINPLNGPGFSINPEYVAQTQRTKAAGIPVYAYVHSLYGQSSLDVIQRNISTYYSWYPIDGIFIDEAAVDCSFVGLYQAIYNFVKARGGVVIINPGYQPSECYMSTADIILNAENRWDLYMVPYVPPAWVYKYPANRFWHVVWGVPQSDVWSVINVANSRNAGYVFVTDAGGDNPYDKLPSYWGALINAQMHTNGVSIEGGTSSAVWAPSIDKCDQQCKNTAGCFGWTYDVCGGGTCWLNNGAGTITPRTCRAAVRLVPSTSAPVSALSHLELSTATTIGKYNFAPFGAPTPGGYETDSGSPFGGKADGRSYGWNAANPNAIQRNSPASPSPLHDTHIRMQVNGWWYHWEIAVPVGFYSVRVIAGDPTSYACQEMSIEGQHLVSGCPTAASPYVEYNGVVSVSDGRLSIANTPGAWSDNKLCVVEVYVASGTTLSTTVSTAASAKRQSLPTAANATIEERFINALCAITNQPRERFRVLKTTSSGADLVTIDYIVLDPDLIPDPNVTALATEVATIVLSAKEHLWTDAGMRFVTQRVVNEEGPVPSKYNKATSIALYVMVGLTVLAICLLAAAVTAFFVWRSRQQRALASAVSTTSTTELMAGRLSRQSSDANLLQTPGGSNVSVASSEGTAPDTPVAPKDLPAVV